MVDYVIYNGSKIKQLFPFTHYGCKVKLYSWEYILPPKKIQQPTCTFIEKHRVLGCGKRSRTNRRERESEREREQTILPFIAENWPTALWELSKPTVRKSGVRKRGCWTDCYPWEWVKKHRVFKLSEALKESHLIKSGPCRIISLQLTWSQPIRDSHHTHNIPSIHVWLSKWDLCFHLAKLPHQKVITYGNKVNWA